MSETIAMISSLIFISVIMFFMGLYINKFSNAGIYFGVRVPKKFQKDKDILILEKSYKKAYLATVLPIIIIVNMILIYKPDELLMLIFTFLIIFLAMILQVIYWEKMKRLKKSKGWDIESRNVVVVDTTLRKPNKNGDIKPISNKFYWYMLIIPVIVAVITFFKYEDLPQMVAIHFNGSGVADNLVDKNTISGAFNIFFSPIMQIVMIVLFALMNRYIINSKADLNSGTVKGIIEKKKKFRRLISVGIWLTSLEVIMVVAFMQMAIIYNLNVVIISTVATSVILISVLIFVIYSFAIGQGGRNIEVSEGGEELYRDDDEKWILGSMYYNKNDSSIFVEKRIGVGWTINLGHPVGMFIMILTILFILGTIIMVGVTS